MSMLIFGRATYTDFQKERDEPSSLCIVKIIYNNILNLLLFTVIQNQVALRDDALFDESL